MSAPNVVSVEPADSETDVILGTVIFVTFDQEIDPTTVTDATFSLTGPGQASRTRSLRPLPRKAPRAHAWKVEDSQESYAEAEAALPRAGRDAGFDLAILHQTGAAPRRASDSCW